MENDVSSAADEAYASIVCEFLEVAIHFILYVREVYPPGIFQRMRKYNVPVHICVHPELNQYIRRVVNSIKPQIEAGQVDRLTVIIKNKESAPVEQFLLDAQKGSYSDICSQQFFEELERDLRMMLLKISVSDAQLAANPPDCTFTVEVGMSESGMTAMEQQTHQDFPWIVEEKVGRERVDFNNCSSWSLVPLKSISNALLKLTVLARECRSRKNC